jgi:hypothetical protein
MLQTAELEDTMENENSNRPEIPFGLQQLQSPCPVHGEVYPVNPNSYWRNERAWCVYNSYVAPDESLVYHFHDGSRWCFYDFDGRNLSDGNRGIITKMVPAGVDPYRWAWQNFVPYVRITGSSDASICEVIKMLAAQVSPLRLVGWSIADALGVAVPAFIQKRSAGSHYLTGEIALEKISNRDSQNIEKLGSLDDAVIALKYVKRVLGISIGQALSQLDAYERKKHDVLVSEGHDIHPMFTIDCLQSSSLVDETRGYPEGIRQSEHPVDDENGMTEEDYIEEFKHAHCMTDEEFDEYMESRIENI